MNHFLKGAAVAAVILIVLMVMNVCCNMMGVDLDSTSTGVVSGICGMFIYNRLIQNEKNKCTQERQ